jgi:hypothetical protein
MEIIHKVVDIVPVHVGMNIGNVVPGFSLPI